MRGPSMAGSIQTRCGRSRAPRQSDQLKELGGIGDFSAELILLRGAGGPDWAPRREPRLISAMKLAYARADLDHDEVADITSV